MTFQPHPFDPTALGRSDGGEWSDPIPCPELDPADLVEADPTLTPHLTPSIFEPENETQ